MVDSVAVIVKRVLAQLVDRVVKQDLVAHIDAVLVRGRRLEEEGRRLEEEGRRLEEEGRRLEELRQTALAPGGHSARAFKMGRHACHQERSLKIRQSHASAQARSTG